MRLAAGVVPSAWRATVIRDLAHEASRDGRGRAWFAWHVMRVGMRLRFNRPAKPGGTPMKAAGTAGWTGDLRMAARNVVRQPMATLAIVLTVALGVAATTATFGVFNLVVFRPVPGVSGADRIVSIYIQSETARTSASFAHFEALRHDVPALDDVAAWGFSDVPFSLDAAGPREMIQVSPVTSAYFDALGARPRLGRLPSAFQPDAFSDPIVTVSERFWRLRLGADPAVVGRSVYLNGRPFVVAAVVAEFRGSNLAALPLDMWVPMGSSWTDEPPDRAPEVFQLIGRLHAGATREEAQAQAFAAWHAVGDLVMEKRAYRPLVFAGLTDGFGVTRQRLLNVFWILEGGMVMLLLLSCANAANLLIARNARRSRDLAVRRALGASRARLGRLLLIEALTEAALAAGLGLLLARAFMELFRGASLLTYLPALDDLALDWRVAGVAIGIAVVTMVTCAIVPAWIATRIDPVNGLRGAGRTTRTTHARSSLVALQFALSLTLLASAGVLVDTVSHLRSVDLGFRSDGLVSLLLSPVQLGYDDDRDDRLFVDIRSRLLQTPGIESASVSWSSPLESAQGSGFRVSAGEKAVNLRVDYVSPGYFKTMGIPFEAGRDLTSADARTGSVVPVVLSRLAAQKAFGSADVLGRTLLSGDARWPNRSFVIAGLVGDIRRGDLRGEFEPTVYEPSTHALRRAAVVVRSTRPTVDTIETMRAVIHDIDPALPIGKVLTIPARLDELTGGERLLARLGSAVALLASLLAAGGLYALISFVVAERTRELGIRIALGASAARVMRDVLRGVVIIGTLGLAAGGLLMVLASRWLTAHLFGVTAFDPMALSTAVVLLGAVALLAGSVPARRASRVNPVVALRVD